MFEQLTTQNLLDVSKWIRDGNIEPLKWGDTYKEIQNIAPNSASEIIKMRDNGFPFIILDFVEFYFDSHEYAGLEEVIIKPIALYNGSVHKYFSPGWLTQGMTHKEIADKLSGLSINYKVEYGPDFRTPNIQTEAGFLFAFSSDRGNDDEAELIKIYFCEQRRG